jgi:hypothetical protein
MGESRVKTNGKPVLQLTSGTEESTEVIQNCLAEDRTSGVRMVEEMTGSTQDISRRFEKEKSVCSFCSFVNDESRTSTRCIVC